MQLNKNLVFVVSGGRTGTAFFGAMLGDHIEDCFSIHEPDMLRTRLGFLGLSKRIVWFGFQHMVIGRFLGTHGLRPLGDRYLSGKIDISTAADTIKTYRDNYHATLNESLVIESNAQWYSLLHPLRLAYPKSKVVCIVRDPRTWVTSTLNYGLHRGSKDLVQKVGQRRISPSMIGDYKWEDRWGEMTPFQRLCWDWTLINDLLNEFVQSDDRARLFRFEDLFDTQSPEVRRELFQFITVHNGRQYSYKDPDSALRKQINVSSGNMADWPKWPKEDAQFLYSMCGNLMRQFGYGMEPEWQDLVEEKNTISSKNR